MAWQDRLVEPSYTSPSGRVITFQYENVSKSFARRTTAFDFPDVDGSFVQDLGRSGRRFPLRMIFSGDDYDLLANQLDSMLEEIGIGTLEHPEYGRHRVVPFGDVNRRDDLKTAANQAIIEVTFFETIDLLFPLSATSPADETEAAVDAFLDAAPADFSDKVDATDTTKAVTLRSRYRSVVDQVEAGLRDVAAVNEEIESAFDTVFQSINSDIDTLVATPLTLAFQAGIISQIPARSSALIVDRLEAYGNLLTSLTSQLTYTPSADAQSANSFRNDDLFAANMIAGAITSVLNNEFQVKSEAIAAAEDILAMCEEWVAWRDLNLVSLSEIDTGEMYQTVSRACSIAAGFLVEISFSLKQERSLVLVRARTLIDLEAELYGTIDSNLDFLITTNNLVGEEILEVPAGRTIKFYV